MVYKGGPTIISDHTQAKDLFEEQLNCLTHAIGAILAGIGTYFLVKQSLVFSDDLRVIAALLYGTTITITLGLSAMFHGTKCKLLKRKFRIMDHASIYLMIAGSYSPLLLIPLKGKFGLIVLIATWLFAFLGILWKVFYFRASKTLSIASYMILGWMGVFLINPMLETVPTVGLLLILVGGVVYTIGTFFYINDHRKYFHTIWHVLVLIGCAIHYFAISEYVITL